jgi:hypothetical protein
MPEVTQSPAPSSTEGVLTQEDIERIKDYLSGAPEYSDETLRKTGLFDGIPAGKKETRKKFYLGILPEMDLNTTDFKMEDAYCQGVFLADITVEDDLVVFLGSRDQKNKKLIIPLKVPVSLLCSDKIKRGFSINVCSSRSVGGSAYILEKTKDEGRAKEIVGELLDMPVGICLCFKKAEPSTYPQNEKYVVGLNGQVDYNRSLIASLYISPSQEKPLMKRLASSGKITTKLVMKAYSVVELDNISFDKLPWVGEFIITQDNADRIKDY